MHSSDVLTCARCGAELPEGGNCIDCEDAVEVTSELVYAGSRWTTRGGIPRKVVVLSVSAGFATVTDESSGEIWVEEALRIERAWTRRAQQRRQHSDSVSP